MDENWTLRFGVSIKGKDHPKQYMSRDHLLNHFFALCSILAIFWGLQMTVNNTRFALW